MENKFVVVPSTTVFYEVFSPYRKPFWLSAPGRNFCDFLFLEDDELSPRCGSCKNEGRRGRQSNVKGSNKRKTKFFQRCLSVQ